MRRQPMINSNENMSRRVKRPMPKSASIIALCCRKSLLEPKRARIARPGAKTNNAARPKCGAKRGMTRVRGEIRPGGRPCGGRIKIGCALFFERPPAIIEAGQSARRKQARPSPRERLATKWLRPAEESVSLSARSMRTRGASCLPRYKRPATKLGGEGYAHHRQQPNIIAPCPS